jgi:3-hydroxyisobutyrate dehydrogenase-like beta-hydroxyacid dehydrogenase
MRIGWIGLGTMGLGMARCAARAGHEVLGHTRGRAEHLSLVADGGRLSNDLVEVAAAPFVCINVLAEAQLRDVLYTQGVLNRLTSGTIMIIHTTSSPALTQHIQSDAPAGVDVIDAAFSGSREQAALGQLTMMVGGEATAVSCAQSLLQTYATYLRHVGPLGTGMQLKLLNSLLFAAQVHLVAEVFGLAAHAGIAADVLLEVLTRSSARSRALEIVGAHGTVEQNVQQLQKYFVKDVAAAHASATAVGMDLGVVGSLASQAFPPIDR